MMNGYSLVRLQPKQVLKAGDTMTGMLTMENDNYGPIVIKRTSGTTHFAGLSAGGNYQQSNYVWIDPAVAGPKIKVGGAYKNVTNTHIKVSGAYKQVTEIYVKVGGVYKKIVN